MKLQGKEWDKICYVVEQGLVIDVLDQAEKQGLPATVQHALLLAIRVVQQKMLGSAALAETYRNYRALYKSLPAKYTKDLKVYI